jgi:Domain of unknown function (DUF5658)
MKDPQEESDTDCMEVSLSSSGSSKSQEAAPAAERSCRTPSSRRHARSQTGDRRFFWLLVGVWIVNCFDLELTLLAAQQRMLWEVNPVVGQLLPYGPKVLTIYKFGLLGLGTAVLWRFRWHPIARKALWLIAIACVALSLVWYQLYFGPEPAWGGINTAISAG